MKVAACVLTVELHLPAAHSLKDKRGIIEPVLSQARVRFGVAAAEVGQQDLRQRATLAFAAVAGSFHHAEEVLDSVERLVWSRPGLEVVTSERAWLEQD